MHPSYSFNSNVTHSYGNHVIIIIIITIDVAAATIRVSPNGAGARTSSGSATRHTTQRRSGPAESRSWTSSFKVRQPHHTARCGRRQVRAQCPVPNDLRPTCPGPPGSAACLLRGPDGRAAHRMQPLWASVPLPVWAIARPPVSLGTPSPPWSLRIRVAVRVLIAPADRDGQS
jgi:hypothetical protein